MQEQTTDLTKIPTEEQIISQEVAKLDPYEIRANELKEKYTPLIALIIQNKDDFEAIYEAEKSLSRIRIDSEKDRKAYNEPFNNIIKSINEKGKKIAAIITPLEDKLNEKRVKWEKEQEAEKIRKKQFEENRYLQRTMELTRMGVMLDDSSYFVLDDVEIASDLVKGTDDDVYEPILQRFKDKYAVIEAERKSEEDKKAAEQKELEDLRKQKEELDAFKRQQIEIRAKTRILLLPHTIPSYSGKDAVCSFTHELICTDEELKYLNDNEFDEIVKKRTKNVEVFQKQIEEDKKKEEQRVEKERIEKEKTDARINTLYEIGMTAHFGHNSYIGRCGANIAFFELTQWDDEKFDSTVEKIKNRFKQDDEEIEAKRLTDLAESNRKAAAKALAEKEETDRIAEEKRLEELATSNDAAKWKDLVKQMEGINWPDMKSRKYKSLVSAAKAAVFNNIFEIEKK